MMMRLVLILAVSAACGWLQAVVEAGDLPAGFQLPRPVVPTGIKRKTTSLLLDRRSSSAGFPGGFGYSGYGGAKTRAQQASSWYDYRHRSNDRGATVLEREPLRPPSTRSPHSYFNEQQQQPPYDVRMRRPNNNRYDAMWNDRRRHDDGPRLSRSRQQLEEEYQQQQQDEYDYVRGIRQSLEELRREHKEMLHEERQLHQQNEMNQLERIRHQAKLLEQREEQQMREDERQRRHYEAIMEERRREQGYHQASMSMEQRRNEEIRRKYQEHIMRQREQRRPSRPGVELDTDKKRARELQEARHRYYEEEARRRVQAQQEERERLMRERERRQEEERQYEELMIKRREAQRYAAEQRQDQERRRQLEEDRRHFQREQQQQERMNRRAQEEEEEEEEQERNRRQREERHEQTPQQAVQKPQFQQQQHQQASPAGFGEVEADDELNKTPRGNPAGVSYVRYKKNRDEVYEEDAEAAKPQKVYERYVPTKAAAKASIAQEKEQPFQLKRYPQQMQGRFERYKRDSPSAPTSQAPSSSSSAYVRYEKPSLDSPQEMPQQQQWQSSPSDGIRMERYVSASPRDVGGNDKGPKSRFERYVPEPKQEERSVFDKYMRYERPPPEVIAAQQQQKTRLEQPQQQQFHQPPLEQLERYVKPQDSNQPSSYQDVYRGLRKQEKLDHEKRESFQHGLSGTYFTPGRYGGT